MGPASSHLDTHSAEDAPTPAVYIDSDKKCRTCGYELRGLPVGGNCPECGQPTFIPPTIDNPLSLMPRGVIRRLKWGCWAAFWYMALTIVLVLMLWWSTIPKMVIHVAMLALAISWQAGVRLAIPALELPQATIRSFSSRSRMRFATHWLQIGWLVASMGGVLKMAFPGPSPLDDVYVIMIRYGLMVGILGLVLLAIMQERIADWCRDDEAKRSLLWVMWCLIPAAWFFSIQPALSLWTVLFYVASALVVMLYPVSLLKLARSVGYCVHHAMEHEGQMERQQEKRDRFFSSVIDPYIEATGEKDPAE